MSRGRGEDRGDGRLRWRALWAAALAAAVVVGTLTLEDDLGVRALEPAEAPPGVSGVWFCPHGGGEGWRAWVVVANPSAGEAALRLTTYGSSSPRARRESVPAGAQRFFEVPAPEMAAATGVEFFGEAVAAGMVAVRAGDGGLAAEPCLRAAGARWYVTGGTSLRGEGHRLVVVNPFPQEAVFDVVLSDGRGTLRPGELTGVVLRARRAAAFDLGAFALGKRALSATVSVELGKVAVAGIGLTDTSVRAAVGATAPARRWVLPGGGDSGPGQLVGLNPGARPAPFRARVQGEVAQSEVLGEAALGAGLSKAFAVEAPGAGLIVEAAGPQPLVAVRRLARAERSAATGGARGGAASWLALPAASPEGAASVLVLQNPGSGVADVRISFLTGEGAAQAPGVAEVALAPGRTRLIPLPELFGQQPVTAVVRAERGEVVAAQAAFSPRGYALAVGVPFSMPGGQTPM